LIAGARYVHTNIIARDWRALAAFYTEVFGCSFVPPERDLAGRDLERGTGIADATLRGVHLRLPGHGERGPTLEIFSYGAHTDPGRRAMNRPGLTHLAFEVDDVAAAQREVLARGGSAVGEVVSLTIANGARVTWCYVTDPEGNAIELQSWR
jgi:glyoxylase I family protein